MYQYSLNNGDWTNIPGNASSYQIGGLQNGTGYSVRVRAVTPIEGTNYEGEPSAPSNTGTPYGPLSQPSVSASGNAKSVTLNWSTPGGNGRDIAAIEVLVDGVPSSSAPSGSVTVGDAYSETHSIKVTITDTAGQSSSAETSATSQDAPPKGAFLSSWASCDGTGLTNGPPCVRMQITVENFLGQGSVTCTWDSDSAQGDLTTTIPVDGNGNGSKQLSWYTQDSGAYSLENQASRMSCDGVGMRVRR